MTLACVKFDVPNTTKPNITNRKHDKYIFNKLDFTSIFKKANARNNSLSF